MSVINKMLRDLDARRADGAVPDHPRQASPAAMQGTTSVLTSARRPFAPWLLLVLLLLVAGAAGYWYLATGVSPTPPVLPPVAADPPALSPALAASAPEPMASAPVEPAVVASEVPAVTEPEAVAAAEPVVSRKKKRQTEVSEAETQTSAMAEHKERQGKKRASSSAPDKVTPAPSVALATATPPSSATVSAPAASVAPLRRQGLAQETLAQAQVLWSAGSREPALELLREAVAVVERSQPVDVPLLAQLVREQVRMELAQGRPAAVLGVLSRLEPVLSGQADLWAVRGNAAQRLGRHQEAVQAYLAALQLRPGEPRWMLGAAVSLAALGQLDAAAQQAEQARALGPVSPEVLAYLRQAGVPLR